MVRWEEAERERRRREDEEEYLAKNPWMKKSKDPPSLPAGAKEEGSPTSKPSGKERKQAKEEKRVKEVDEVDDSDKEQKSAAAPEVKLGAC